MGTSLLSLKQADVEPDVKWHDIDRAYRQLERERAEGGGQKGICPGTDRVGN